MKHKTIEIHGCETAKEVVLIIQREEERDFVEITIWHEVDGGSLIQQEEIEFGSMLMMERFICDFSEASANDLANSCDL